ncbi:hypothetical protein Dsin_014771 [Dipteronia sinensis]|uniref:HTH myb-type domain-containing protein n=1 Tax=Dipteronia sinensis TaxID=43782 RepID=A0AAE0AMK9_9ROSI|nr:hypothetical protein Dsin_014771 [Dipteronia sinensis]
MWMVRLSVLRKDNKGSKPLRKWQNWHHVRCNEECLKVSEKGISMSWDMVDIEELWLSRSTIGVLTKFSDVTKINVVMGGKCFGVKILKEQTSIYSFWLEKFIGTFPMGGRNGKNFFLVKEVSRYDGGGVSPFSVMEHMEEVKKVSPDGDKSIHMDNYKRDVVAAKHILFKLNFENVQDIGEVYGDVSFSLSSVKDLSLGLNSNSLFFRGTGSISDKSIEGDLGQEVVFRDLRVKNPSEEKLKDGVVIKDPLSEISSNVKSSDSVGVKVVLSHPPSLFHADRTELISCSEGDIWCENLTRKAGSVVTELIDVSLGVSKKRNERKSSVSMKGHNMILRSYGACEIMKQQNPKLINNVVWNLEDEVVKVLEKAMSSDDRKSMIPKNLASGGDLNNVSYSVASKKRKSMMSESVQGGLSTVEKISHAHQEITSAATSYVNPNLEGKNTSARTKTVIVWTDELEDKFLEAVTHFNTVEKATPTPNKILKRMNVTGITWKNVASHLQIFPRKSDEKTKKKL